MISRYSVVQHEVKCQHTREYPYATANGDSDIPRLSVKQYIPHSNSNPQPGDVTIIAAHANATPKEVYEPLWDDIEDISRQHGFKIRSVWMADIWTQGESGRRNEDILGNDPNWFDHSRDLLYLINQKQEAMPHPIIGIGHSGGATQLAYLSLIHPRLLTSLVLMEPVIQIHNPGIAPAILSTFRRDRWPSRVAAIESFQKSRYYRAWDPRVLDRWFQYGLRDDPRDDSVTLATTKTQELVMYMRPTYRGDPNMSPYDDKNNYADLDPKEPKDNQDYPFYRPEPAHVFKRLPELHPGVLYLYGEKSEFGKSEDLSVARGWEQKLSMTGTGVGGSGGAQLGRVKQAIISDAGHFAPLEKSQECAKSIAEFVDGEMKLWRRNAEAVEKHRSQSTRAERASVDRRWEDNVDPSRKPVRSNKGKSLL